MTTPGVPEQYLTIEPWLGALPSWVPANDQVRIATYGRYEEIYWSSEEGFEEVMRGDNDNPVFMPTARTIVNTVSRYTATGFGWTVSPLIEAGLDETGEPAAAIDPEGVAIAQLAFDQLFVREQFLSKFNSEKNKGIRRGDWLFHIIGDDTKPAGRRLKILTIHPSSYFPVYEDDLIPGGDPNKLIKVHIAEQVRVNNQDRVSRLTYERLFDSKGVQTAIQVSHGIFKADEWAKAGVVSPETWIIQPKELDPTIPAIPIYHLKNMDSTERFGSSEMRGGESVLLGINQTMSDEDMTLALDGIGVYATDGGPPVDAQGNQVDWIMGPGRVMHHAHGLTRINGTSSVTPYGDHYNRLYDSLKEATGVSDVAIGKVDSATAESGVALMIQLGPILSYTGDKDQHIVDVMGQMFHDLCFWFQIYEELPLLVSGEEGSLTPRVRVQPTIGDKIPLNKKQLIDQVLALRAMVPPLISLETAHNMLRTAGVPISDTEAQALQLEAAAQAATDALAFGGAVDTTTDTRVDSELNGEVL